MSSIKEKVELVYEECLKKAPGTIFYQDDLTAFNIVSGVQELQEICQELVRLQRFRIFTGNGQICWKSRRQQDADKLVAVSSDERLVYNHIESAGAVGAWSKSIKSKTNLHQSVVNKCIKSLEAYSLVKEVKSVKYPARKIYMVKYLSPVEETSGGFFFTDGVIDTALIDALNEFILRYVQQYSWEEQMVYERGTNYQLEEISERQNSHKKRKTCHVNDELCEEDVKRCSQSAPNPIPTSRANVQAVALESLILPPRHPRTNSIIVPRHPTYELFPTAGRIHKAVSESGFIQGGMEINNDNIQHLLDALVYDGKLELVKIPRKVISGRNPSSSSSSSLTKSNLDKSIDNLDTLSTLGYRLVRPLLYQPPPLAKKFKRTFASNKPPVYYISAYQNGFSEAPCSRCPAFTLCESGGIVSPENCEYFDRWLGLESEYVAGGEDYSNHQEMANGEFSINGSSDSMNCVKSSQPFDGVGPVGVGFAEAQKSDKSSWWHA